MKTVVAEYYHPKLFYSTKWTIFMTIMTIGFWPLLIHFGSRRYIGKLSVGEVFDLKGRAHRWNNLRKVTIFEFDESRSHLTGYSVYKFVSGKIVFKKEFIKNSKEIEHFIKKLNLKVSTEYKALAV